MDIRVSGHQVDTGDALREHVETRMSALAEKYFPRAISSRVTFGKGPYDHSFVCDIVAHPMQDLVIKGSGQAIEAHPAFEQAADRVEKQLRRYNRRLKDHHGAAETRQRGEAAEAAYTVFAHPDDDSEPLDHPPVVAETKVDVPAATVSHAVMLLDLRNTNALMFKNSSTGSFNMVYRRGDGTIGWVEPQRD